nr:high affinity cationic amino acid transporter 1-like isoform X2 [Procambarus clarkii]
MSSFVDRLTRRKFVTFEDTELPRVLNTVDLTLLGVGSTIGVGIYVLAGKVASETAGPAVTISFLIAAVASVLAGLCYAEFGARVPKAGSAYVYTYVCIGEFVAFVIGWNLILEYVIGTASVASGYSGYVDKLTNNTISIALTEAMPINVSFLSSYPNFLAFGLSFAISVALSLGVKNSSRMNNLFTTVNMLVIIYVIIAAGTKANVKNWAIPESSLNDTCTEDLRKNQEDWGVGGFTPYGFNGIMQGAASCFFGFVGFDCIATTGEEAINPQRSIPIAISISLLLVFLSYFGISSVLTLAVPYCMADPDAPLVELFVQLGWEVSKWIVSVGALVGFSASLFGAMFPLPRVIYAMANDGLVFRFLSRVDKRFHTPAIATLLSGLFSGLMSMFFDLDKLVDMMSIGTLLAYSIVAVCVMLLRYAEGEDTHLKSSSESGDTRKSHFSSEHSAMAYVKQLFNVKGLKEPTDLSSSLASYATLSYCCLAFILALLLKLLQTQLAQGDLRAIMGVGITALLCFLNIVVLSRQPESKNKLSFKVPFVPWTPALSALFNLYLMANLPVDTWIRFGIWMAIGFLIYFGYGLWNSSEELSTSEAKYGINNPAFIGNGKMDKNPNGLVIPTIEIHLATPANSRPNTPKAIEKNKQKTPLPISPLVAVVIEPRQSASTDVDVVDTGYSSEQEIQIAIVLSDKVSSEVTKGEEKRLQSETRDSHLKGDHPSLSMLSEGTREPFSDDDHGRDLSPLPGEEVSMTNREENKSLETVKKTGNSNSGCVSLQQLFEDNPTKLNDSVKDDPNDPGYVTLEDVKAQIAEIHVATENKMETSENLTNTESANKEKALPLENSEKVGDSDSSDKFNKQEDPIYATVNKKAKNKSGPLKDASDFNNSLSEDNMEDQPVLRNVQSAPILYPSTPPPTPPPIPFKLIGYSHSSVPSTPVSNKHPFKILKRNSSFDGIPPSSPDSPHARRLGNKFVIIPVKEPGTDSDNDSINLVSSQASLLDDEQESHAQNIDEQNVLMNELVLKLENHSELSASDIHKGEKPHKIFTIGSDDSLESALMGTNTNNFINNLPSPTITNQTREFKKVFSKDSALEVLDTIRERGESKILSGEEDKTDVKTSGKSIETSADAGSVLEK